MLPRSAPCYCLSGNCHVRTSESSKQNGYILQDNCHVCYAFVKVSLTPNWRVRKFILLATNPQVQKVVHTQILDYISSCSGSLEMRLTIHGI